MRRPREIGLSGRAVLSGFAFGGAALYLAVLLAVTLALGEPLPLLAWAGFGVVVAVSAAAAAGLASFLVGSSHAGR